MILVVVSSSLTSSEVSALIFSSFPELAALATRFDGSLTDIPAMDQRPKTKKLVKNDADSL